ncbi:methyl-accepting chemotaxis sensory transducer [Desulforamulus reducens MI-1]|uniref:Methyl-accepting chemotaxis sensory transducer n=1 Tax=Desulforamulus reducens (strain ATCC BAA-1160 / DSM 100696 / MI-1) TaxID=349161 RepID=A4J6S1_DESRM|nr:methyl-accepting chemotaxis protein [Desulforamulus reducens]ABO50774.1 methyl-accepting chemotaxis sensory transducer [Desulforamulus reducens MI-1]
MNMTVRKRLFLSYGLLIGLIISLGFYASFTMSRINDKSTEIADYWLAGVQHAEEINTLIADIRTSEYRHILATETAEMKAMEESIAENKKKINANFTAYEKSIASDQDRNLYTVLMSEWKNYLSSNEKVLALSDSGQKEEALKVMKGESLTLYNAAAVAAKEMAKYNQENSAMASQEGDSLHHQSILMLSLVILLAVGLGIAAALYITRSINGPLKEIEERANKLAQGDINIEDIKVRSQDEIGHLAEAFNTMKNNIKNMLNQLIETANQLADVAEGLNEQAQQTAAGATETATTMNEIAATVEQMNSNVQEVSTVSETTANRANAGKEGLNKVTSQIQAITHSTGEVSEVIHQLNQKSMEISKIVNMITGIADQTNLLALNAAIEAARAGEQGRGFAVVAEEVRKLAEQSASATKDISSLINAIQTETHLAVEKIEQGNQEVSTGSVVIQEVGNIFEEIITSVQGLTLQIHHMASAAQQTSAGVQNVAASTEEQTAAMEEVTSTAESLNELSDQLKNLVKQFKI